MPTTVAEPSAFVTWRDRLQSDLLAAYPELIARMSWDRERILAHQRQRLRALLAHAARHAPFHARRLAGIDLDAVWPGDLSALPVLTKTAMMNDLDDVFTDRRLSHRLVEQVLAGTGDEPVAICDEYIAFTSGGSSGQRGVFVYDRDATVQQVGAITRGMVARLQQQGGPPPGGLPIAMVAAASAVHQTGAAPALTAGGALPLHLIGVPVTWPLRHIVDRLNALQPPALFGYPTMLARLAAEQQAGLLRIAPAAITTSAETCTAELRAAIRAGFGAPLVDTFASTEFLVGTSLPGDEAIVFAEDGCIIELVDAQHRPVPPGTPSAKVLVTSLYNRVQPLIRYELTDVFVQQPPAAGHGYLRAHVQGRSDETFHYGAVTIHPLVIRSVLVQAPDVRDYQVHQTATGIDVAAVADPELDTRPLRNALRTALTRAGLHHPDVRLRAVPALDRNPHTGKLPRFVPLDT